MLSSRADADSETLGHGSLPCFFDCLTAGRTGTALLCSGHVLCLVPALRPAIGDGLDAGSHGAGPQLSHRSAACTARPGSSISEKG